jgi:hypothetical protein
LKVRRCGDCQAHQSGRIGLAFDAPHLGSVDKKSAVGSQLSRLDVEFGIAHRPARRRGRAGYMLALLLPIGARKRTTLTALIERIEMSADQIDIRPIRLGWVRFSMLLRYLAERDRRRNPDGSFLTRRWSRAWKSHGTPEEGFSVAGPLVRIRLPPAKSRANSSTDVEETHLFVYGAVLKVRIHGCYNEHYHIG